MMSWFTGMRAMRSTSASVRASSSARGGASSASPHSAASLPDKQSPVNRRRLARCGPSRAVHSAVVGTPHTRAGG